MSEEIDPNALYGPDGIYEPSGEIHYMELLYKKSKCCPNPQPRTSANAPQTESGDKSKQ